MATTTTGSTRQQSDRTTSSDHQEILQDSLLLGATTTTTTTSSTSLSVADRFGVPEPTLAERANLNNNNNKPQTAAVDEKAKASWSKAGDDLASKTRSPTEELLQEEKSSLLLPTEEPQPHQQAAENKAGLLPKTVLQDGFPLPRPLPDAQSVESSVPGAHAVGGLPLFTNRPSPWLTQMLSPSSPSRPAAEDPRPNSSTPLEEDPPEETRDSNAGLVKANPILDSTSSHHHFHHNKNVSQEAQEVDPEAEAKRLAAKQQHTRNMVLAGVVVVLLLMVAAGAVLLILWRLQEQPSEVVSSHSTTGVPSTSTTGMPSGAPSTAPSSLLDSWTSDLPEATIASIREDFGSPQAQAYQWLLSHKDIDTMEPWRKVQLLALATFFYAFEGPHWPKPIAGDWLNDEKHECFWFHNHQDGTFVELAEDGVTFLVEGVPFHQETNPFVMLNDTQCTALMEVKSIALTGLRLGDRNPYIPPEVALLTSLTSILLDANDANHVGPRHFVPSEIGRLSHLRFFRLWGNRVQGTIPSQFGLLSKLSNLDLDSNSFYGTIPSQLFRLPELTELWLTSNDLTGTIPSQVGNLQSLSLLEVSGNRLSGSLPSQVGQAKGLRYLSVFHNRLSGSIPTQLGDIPGLEILFLNDNRLSGRIPARIGNISSVWILELGNNQITGSIPSQIGLLSNAMQVGLDNNGLTGTIPTQVGAMGLLQSLDLANNDLSGPLPSTELARLATIRRLRVSGNSLLTGTVPGDLCVLSLSSSCSYRHWRGVGGHLARNVNCSVDFDCSPDLCGCDCSCD